MARRVLTTIVGGALKVLGSAIKGAGSLVTHAPRSPRTPKHTSPSDTERS